ncbi:MAG: hypothetical protein U0176_21960 [Bacteroidia bacterium]
MAPGRTVQPGTPAAPFATISYAISQLSGRQHIRVASGAITEPNVVNIPDNLSDRRFLVTSGNQ